MRYLVHYSANDSLARGDSKNIILENEEELKNFVEQKELRDELNYVKEKIRSGRHLAVGEEGPTSIQSKIDALVIYNIMPLPF